MRLFRKQYESVFSTPLQNKKVNDQEVFFKSYDETNIQDIEFCEDDMIAAIKELKPESAPGPHGFPSIALKKCSTTLALPLCLRWRKSLDAGKIPRY